MFCGATKTLAMGIPLINALNGNNHQDMSGVLSLPLQEIVNVLIFLLILGHFESTVQRTVSNFFKFI